MHDHARTVDVARQEAHALREPQAARVDQRELDIVALRDYSVRLVVTDIGQVKDLALVTRCFDEAFTLEFLKDCDPLGGVSCVSLRVELSTARLDDRAANHVNAKNTAVSILARRFQEIARRV